MLSRTAAATLLLTGANALVRPDEVVCVYPF
jgi:hypothetical protein